MKYLALLILCISISHLSAQSDSSSGKNSPTPAHRTYTQRDTLYLSKLNNAGNLMIAGGVGLCGVGTYLIYSGVKIYNSSVAGSATPADDLQRNHRQGTIYLAAGGISIAGGIVLVALGAKNKVDFKIRKKIMSLQSGLLDNGNLGMAVNF